jgi:nitrilase
MSAQGAQLFIVPAAFTVPTGRAHWDLLLRARAVENLCYVVASGQWGQHENGRETWGHSQIIDSWGERCSVLPEGEGCVLADIDLEQQAALRSRFPALTHRVLG